MLRRASHAGILPAEIWKRLPAQAIFRVCLSREGSFQYAAATNDAIGRVLYWRGVTAFEAETTHIFRRLAENARVFLDIGANTGLYTLLACAANPDLRVLSLNPFRTLPPPLGECRLEWMAQSM